MVAQLRKILGHPDGEAALCAVLSHTQEKERGVIRTWIRRTDDVLNGLRNNT